MRLSIPFVGSAYKLPSLNVDAQNCINWYLTSDPTGKYQQVLMPCPGLKVFRANNNEKNVRGMISLNGKIYAMIDNIFYEIDSLGQEKSLGTFPTTIGNVRFIASDWQIFMTDGLYAYIYQLKDSNTQADNSRKAGDFFQVSTMGSVIGSPTFLGTGLDDMITSGTYHGTTNQSFIVIIESTGTPDKFKWSNDSGATYHTGISITASLPIALGSDGVTVTFTNSTGHTVGDRWDFTVSYDDLFYVPLIPIYHDSYGIYVRQNSNIFYISDDPPWDLGVLDALQYTILPSAGGYIKAAISVREELWFLCEQNTLIYYNTGASPFPFERRANVLINYGCAAPYSLAMGENNILFWLGTGQNGDRVVLMCSAYDPLPISTEALNHELLSYSKVDDAIGFVYIWEGHIFYTLIFPTEDKTWVFDLTTKSWHERQSTYSNTIPKSSDTRQGRWRANCYVNLNGKHLVGDFESGNIYELSSSTFTENGNLLICERTTQHLQKDLCRIFNYSLQVDVQAGVGLTTGQGSDPQIMLQVSRDGGHKFESERWRNAGKIGEYTRRAKWNRLGKARNFTYRIRISDPVYRVLLGAIADMEVIPE